MHTTTAAAAVQLETGNDTCGKNGHSQCSHISYEEN